MAFMGYPSFGSSKITRYKIRHKYSPFFLFFFFFFLFFFFSFDSACRYTNDTQWIVNENLPLFKLKGCSSLSNEKHWTI